MRIALALSCLALLVTSVAADSRRTPARREPGALVLVVDRSGSMQGPRLEAVKAAAKAAVGAMHPDDLVSIVTFDSEANVAVQPVAAKQRADIGKHLDGVKAGGGTNILPGLERAKQVLAGIKLTKKHVIVLSDGQAPADGIEALVTGMHEGLITVSTVALGDEADEALLDLIAKAGGGRKYKVTDLKTLSQTFVKELGQAKLAMK